MKIYSLFYSDPNGNEKAWATVHLKYAILISCDNMETYREESHW